MHSEVYTWVDQKLKKHNIQVQGKEILEIGSWNINGTIRPLFKGSSCYIGVDRVEGNCVDVVADAVIYDGGGMFDICVSISSMEHDSNPINIVKCAYKSLKKGGLFIVTCAGPQTAPHNCDGRPLTTDPYSVINLDNLKDYLVKTGFEVIELTEIQKPNDICAIGRKKL